jgi:septum formation protein
MKQQIILASQSRQRKLIMDALGIDYKIIMADIDEKAIRDEDLKNRAEKIARAKAEKIAKENEGIIIAADTFAVCDGKILEKPDDLEEAKKMLKMESDNKIVVYTGFCYLDKNNNIDFSDVSISNLTLREMSDNEINNFVENNPVLQWSAAFSPLYLYQTTFIKYFEGSITGVYGLPTELLTECFKKSGIKIGGSKL